MFKNKKAANELHELLKEVCQIIDDGRELVANGKYSQEEQDLYCNNMESVLNNEIGQLLNAIWEQHPQLRP